MKALKGAKLLKPLFSVGSKVMRAAGKNSNWILAILASIGVIGGTATAVDATVKAVKLCEEKKIEDGKEVVKTVWKLYLPTIGFVVFTVTSILSNAHINAKRFATVTGLLAASHADMKALKDAAKQIVGEGKLDKIETAAAKEQLKDVPFPKEEDIGHTGHGDQLFFFKPCGQFFRSSPEYVDLVMKRFNEEVCSGPEQMGYVSFILNELAMRDCDYGNSYYDLADIRCDGVKEIKADLRYTEWMEVYGKQQVVAVMRLDPPPTYMG